LNKRKHVTFIKYFSAINKT